MTRRSGTDVTELLPQRGPARLVGELLERLPDGVACRGRIPSDSPLVRHGVAAATVAIELAAQAAAVEGALTRADAPAPAGAQPGPLPGYLVGVRDFRVSATGIPADVDVEVEAVREGGAGPLRVYRARVFRDGEEIAAGSVLTWEAADG